MPLGIIECNGKKGNAEKQGFGISGRFNALQNLLQVNVLRMHTGQMRLNPARAR